MMLERLNGGSRSCRDACTSGSVPCPLRSPVTLRILPKRRLAIQPHQLLRVSAIAAGAEASTVKIIVQGRNVELSDSLRSYVNGKVTKAIAKFEAVVKEIDVNLSVAGGDRGLGARKQKTEITIYTHRLGVVRAEDAEESMYASIDLVCDKVERKMRKTKERAIGKGKWPGRAGPRGHAITDSLPEGAEENQAAEDFSIDEIAPPLLEEVMRTKTFFLPPMSAEEALEQVEQIGHPFYVFRERSSDQVQVVYKRSSRGYGLIIPKFIDA